jgi:hypothetical protein
MKRNTVELARKGIKAKVRGREKPSRAPDGRKALG